MRSLLIWTVFLGCCFADTTVLRPCFERYANHRLVNVRPYHSEWRMKTEDMCLLFCAQSASRCRSVVYDTVQHICHYFSDEGVDQAIQSAKMTYLRVVSQSCLQENAEMASDQNILAANSVQQNDIQQEFHPELEIPKPPMEEEMVSSTTESEPQNTEAITPEVVTFETATQPVPPKNDEDLIAVNPLEADEKATETPEDVKIDEADLDDQLTSVMKPSQFTGSFSDSESPVENNGVYRDRASNEQRWIDSVEKMDSKNRNDKKSIDEKLNDLKTEDKEKYDILMGGTKELTEIDDETQKLKDNLRYGAKVIKFDEESAFRKQSEIRRKPVGEKHSSIRPALKPVTIPPTSYIQKAKSFLDDVNEDDDSGNVVITECQPDDVDVWIAFENSEQAEESEDIDIDSNLPNRKECQKMCREKNCRSFTYFEKTHTCHLSTKSDGVTLQAPQDGDFTASTSTKFCYPRTFSVFDGCSNFIAFRDYSVRIEAVEEFDELPRGYEGMQLCVELCVLSTRYTCKSSTFNPVTGKCRLLTEDSLTSPDDFKYDAFQKDLYFENGCATAGNDNSIEKSVDVVTSKPKKMKKRRIRRVKKLQSRH